MVVASVRDGRSDSAFALANADEAFGAFMVATARARIAFYGHGPEALLPRSVERLSEHGMQVRLGPQQAGTRLLGEHNAGNLAAAVSAAMLLGSDRARVVDAKSPGLRGADGRMQRVASGSVLGIVDYAHTRSTRAGARYRAQTCDPTAK